MMSLSGYELLVRDVAKGGTNWRPALFIAVVMHQQGPVPVIGYLATDGKLSLMLGSAELRAMT